MDVKKIAEFISQASATEPTLLFHSPEEVENDLAEGRALALEEAGELVGFCGWKNLGGWLELSTVYVVPKFRGRGYSLKLLSLAQERLASLTQFPNAFLFTQVPLMKKIVSERYGFSHAKYSELPLRVWASILAHRFHPRRLLSYTKYIKGLHMVGAWQLFTLRRG